MKKLPLWFRIFRVFRRWYYFLVYHFEYSTVISRILYWGYTKLYQVRSMLKTVFAIHFISSLDYVSVVWADIIKIFICGLIQVILLKVYQIWYLVSKFKLIFVWKESCCLFTFFGLSLDYICIFSFFGLFLCFICYLLFPWFKHPRTNAICVWLSVLGILCTLGSVFFLYSQLLFGCAQGVEVLFEFSFGQVERKMWTVLQLYEFLQKFCRINNMVLLSQEAVMSKVVLYDCRTPGQVLSHFESFIQQDISSATARHYENGFVFITNILIDVLIIVYRCFLGNRS